MLPIVIAIYRMVQTPMAIGAKSGCIINIIRPTFRERPYVMNF
ncbi:hypothetical protein AmDm5_1734 [Acetobacter malorum]|nr:hypothetical protein AmDm5_1734 [Acetobacter malorum]